MRNAEFQYRSQCPVASALDILGDRWTLVVLRTIFAGRHKFSELLNIPEGVSTNILADRLVLLETHGLVDRRAYQHNPIRFEYFLTRKGADLLPVLQAMARWAFANIPDRWALPDWFENAEPSQFYPSSLHFRQQS
jgi:DNA-binding HxlR family transcriptional regulator